MKCHKKQAAAVAAVFEYIRSEEEALCRASAAGSAPVAAPPTPPVALKLWGASGRQYQMQLRTMMQLKAFHGSRLR